MGRLIDLVLLGLCGAVGVFDLVTLIYRPGEDTVSGSIYRAVVLSPLFVFLAGWLIGWSFAMVGRPDEKMRIVRERYYYGPPNAVDTGRPASGENRG